MKFMRLLALLAVVAMHAIRTSAATPACGSQVGLCQTRVSVFSLLPSSGLTVAPGMAQDHAADCAALKALYGASNQTIYGCRASALHSPALQMCDAAQVGRHRARHLQVEGR